ncbi:MAG: hypothetical protein DI566_05080 [Microbacterium sp.]|nr:MAG: hypothetical protein DI566_05080 [Microbacterium sp.]
MADDEDIARAAGDAVTIYEVAARAGVSIATVSHALNRPERVSAGTLQRVLDTASELGFVPRGRGRATPALRRIVVSGPFSQHETYLARLVGVLGAAQGIDVVVVDDPKPGDPVIDRLQVRGAVDGAIIMGAEPSLELAHELEAQGVAVVLLDRPSQQFASVAVNDEAGGSILADHVMDVGAASIAVVSPPPASSDFVTNGELRLRAFVSRLRERGFTGDVPWTVCDDSLDGGRTAAAELVASGVLPEAVFALHDIIAAGVLAGLREAGVDVPGQVRVVGYDDIDLAGVMGLTTVRQPFARSGEVAVEALRTLRASRNLPVAHITLLPELVTRSTSPAMGADQKEPR